MRPAAEAGPAQPPPLPVVFLLSPEGRGEAVHEARVCGHAAACLAPPWPARRWDLLPVASGTHRPLAHSFPFAPSLSSCHGGRTPELVATVVAPQPPSSLSDLSSSSATSASSSPPSYAMPDAPERPHRHLLQHRSPEIPLGVPLSLDPPRPRRLRQTILCEPPIETPLTSLSRASSSSLHSRNRELHVAGDVTAVAAAAEAQN